MLNFKRSVCVFVFVGLYMYICVCVYLCVCTSVYCVHTCVYGCIGERAYVCVYMHVPHVLTYLQGNRYIGVLRGKEWCSEKSIRARHKEDDSPFSVRTKGTCP